MKNNAKILNITSSLARKLIDEQFPEYSHLPITPVAKQGHDNRTYRLGDELLIRMPTDESYALKVPKEQELLPQLAPHLSINIPVPVKMGSPSKDYEFPFSIYRWLEGTSVNLLMLEKEVIIQLAYDLTKFLRELQSITDVTGPNPGQHNWWRGDHVSVYERGFHDQIAHLAKFIDVAKANDLWRQACNIKWSKNPVWVHGDFAIGNILMQDDKLSAIIDFGGIAVGDPACDLVIAWTFLDGKARDIFIREMALDEDTWLRARAWALWKATFELCQIEDKNSSDGLALRGVINNVLEYKKS
jgi:aminoglycoside phosphotransferase (APT) family kinase protein